MDGRNHFCNDAFTAEINGKGEWKYRPYLDVELKYFRSLGLNVPTNVDSCVTPSISVSFDPLVLVIKPRRPTNDRYSKSIET